MKNVLITGGAGYIGSHTCLSLLQEGHRLQVIDDFSNSSPEGLRRVAELAGLGEWQRHEQDAWGATPTGGKGGPSLQVWRGDVRCRQDLERVFAGDAPIDAVIHFAGLKSVGESIAEPLRYWDVNVAGSLCLLEAMGAAGCRTFLFSSSASIYGYPDTVPIPEDAPVRPITPYGQSKAAVEHLLADLAASGAGWRIGRLRYFNPVGAHPSGRIGEAPCGRPTNLFPLIARVALGLDSELTVFGDDWPTSDGTGVRDYVHVMDLAEGHRAALALLLAEPPQLLTLNLGSGHGHSVLELRSAFVAASGRAVPCRMAPRRPGDMAISVADPSEAERRMGWHVRRSIGDSCRDGWAWYRANPHGYPH